MSTAFKDYYATLGVTRGATEKEIHSAFRKLAREHHPDVTDGDGSAEDRFKEINEAHDILGDPDTRKRYDEVASARWVAADGPEPAGARRRAGWRDIVIIAPIAVNTIYYYAGLPLNAFFIGTRPVLLEFIRGSTVSMIAAGGFARVGKAALPAAILAPVLISMWTDPCYFYAGRRYGRRIIEYYERNDPRWRKRIARGERVFRRFGLWTVVFAPFLPVPSPLFYLAAGEAGMPFLLFILADLAGTLLYIAMFVAIGWFAGQHAVDVAQTITHYAWWIVGGTILLVLGYSIWSSWSSRQTTES